MQPTKWDLILGHKPVPLVTHLMEQVATLFADDLARWPPTIDAFDEVTGAALQVLIAQEPRRPDPRLFDQAFFLTKLDVSRNLDAYDEHLRNQRWMESGLTAKDRAMMLFLSRFMTEQLLGLAEATQGRLSRPQLLDVLERTQRHFVNLGPSL